MAGGFAHITLVDTICKDCDALDAIPSLTPAMKRALAYHLNFVELGAVSPDYPYLSLLDSNSAGWANVMHYWKTLDFVRKAVPIVYEMNFNTAAARKCMAWLFGYAAHLVTDLTIHPMVNLKVGCYEKHKRQHRVCEMNQDVYIFNAVNHDDITRAEYIRSAGIASCCAPGDPNCLDHAVADLWKLCLPDFGEVDFPAKPSLQKPTAAPDPDKWHHRFVFNVDTIAEEGRTLLPLARHIAEELGLVYPPIGDLDRDFIDSLETPEGSMPYDVIFDRARANVMVAWDQLGRALDTNDPSALRIPNGNLDTGRDDTEAMIFWKERP
jgi:hypothetical protein